MVRTRVKICGITRLEDARLAVALGVDALGFVFVPASARHVTLETARRIADALPPFVTRVGLFLDAPRRSVETVLEAMPDIVPQFHGRESGAWCDAFGRRYLKAIGVAEGLPSRAELDAFGRAEGFLLDSNAPGALGGTGHAFDWTRLGAKGDAGSGGGRGANGAGGRAEEGGRTWAGRPLILAGGLDADNVGRAVREVHPYALDVSSGVESAKGIKDEGAMRAFMAAVRRADAERVIDETVDGVPGTAGDGAADGAARGTPRGTANTITTEAKG